LYSRPSLAPTIQRPLAFALFAALFGAKLELKQMLLPLGQSVIYSAK